MQQVSLNDANLVLGSLKTVYNYYSNLGYMFDYCKKDKEAPKYFNKNYVVLLLNSEISVPKKKDFSSNV